MIQGYATPEGYHLQMRKRWRVSQTIKNWKCLSPLTILKKKKKKNWKVFFMVKAKSHEKKSGSVWEEMFQW